jgi:uncharacterized membrane-anchored protein
MASDATDNDRLLAALIWAGWFAGGPIMAIIVFATKRPARRTPLWKHAVAALLMWSVAVVVWLPVFISGVMLRPEEPSSVAVLVGFSLMALTFVLSILGLVVAARSECV